MSTPPVRRTASLVVAAALVILGAAAIARGIDGRSTVRGALNLERVSGEPQMTPAAVAANARKAGLTGIALPACSVAGKQIDNGASARCFAQYMRIDALMATRGKTYAQMPRFATADGKGTDVAAQAQKLPNGVPVNNPARDVWVTETALSTALNTSYMAEQIATFGVAVGAALMLIGLALGAFALGGVRTTSRRFSVAPAVHGKPS